MAGNVSLKAEIGEMEIVGDESSAFLNRDTGEVVSLSDEEISAAEEEVDVEGLPGWQQEMVQKAGEVLGSDDWLKLPDKFDIHEWQIMKDFCDTVDPPERQEELLRAIHGGGAFRYFKDCIHRYGIQDSWYQFLDQALKQIAVEW